jgi:pilus assembly protein CpaF
MGMRNGDIELNTLYRFEEEGERNGRLQGRLQSVEPLKNKRKLREAGLVKEEGG